MGKYLNEDGEFTKEVLPENCVIDEVHEHNPEKGGADLVRRTVILSGEIPQILDEWCKE